MTWNKVNETCFSSMVISKNLQNFLLIQKNSTIHGDFDLPGTYQQKFDGSIVDGSSRPLYFKGRINPAILHIIR